jgi:hypothetical protein
LDRKASTFLLSVLVRGGSVSVRAPPLKHEEPGMPPGSEFGGWGKGSLLRRPLPAIAALGPILLLALLPALLLTLEAGLALLLLALEAGLALLLLALEAGLALNLLALLAPLLLLDLTLSSLLLLEVLALLAGLALDLAQLALLAPLLLLDLALGSLLLLELLALLAGLTLDLVQLALLTQLLLLKLALSPLLLLELLALEARLLARSLALLSLLALSPLLLPLLLLLLAGDLAVLASVEALTLESPLRLLLAELALLPAAPEGLRGGRGRQHRTPGYRAVGRQRHPAPLHLRPEEGDPVVLEARAPVPLILTQIGDLIARHAAGKPLDAVVRHAPVVDRVVAPVVAGDVAAPAIDPLAVRVRRRVVVDARRQEPVVRHEEVVVGRQPNVQRHTRPVVGIRRQGSPADVVVRLLPGDPGRRPIIAGDPLPTVVGVVIPATIVVGRPAVGLVRDPGPAVLGPHPAPVLIGAPGARHVARRPDPAVPRPFDPVAIRGEVVVEEAQVH